MNQKTVGNKKLLNYSHLYTEVMSIRGIEYLWERCGTHVMLRYKEVNIQVQPKKEKKKQSLQ
jgi:hypothetical protein